MRSMTEAVASDDYGVRGIELRYAVNGGAEQSVTIRAANSAPRMEAQGAHTLLLEEINLKPGDLVAYYAAATDGTGQSAQSDIYFMEVRPFTRITGRRSPAVPEREGRAARRSRRAISCGGSVTLLPAPTT